MKILNTRFHGLKIIKGMTYYDERGYFREIYKNIFFNIKNLSLGLFLNPKKMFLGVFIFKKNFNKTKLFL
jgi:dTDP-4-dehydrorhamnose 3,5-epimerase-like enzyme